MVISLDGNRDSIEFHILNFTDKICSLNLQFKIAPKKNPYLPQIDKWQCILVYYTVVKENQEYKYIIKY